MTMADWYEVAARSGTGDLWVACTALQKPKLMDQPWLLEDGTDVYDLLYEDRPQDIPYPVCFRPPPGSKGTRRGDMLWTTGTTKIASTAMVKTLEAIGATGWSTFPVDVRDRAEDPIEAYVGLHVHSDNPSTDVMRLFGNHNYVFLARSHVIDALRSSGADALDIREHDPGEYDDVRTAAPGIDPSVYCTQTLCDGATGSRSAP